MVVKVSMPTGNQLQARVTTKDGSINMKVPTAIISRRFSEPTAIAFFNATFDKSGILEIGERVPNEAW